MEQRDDGLPAARRGLAALLPSDPADPDAWLSLPAWGRLLHWSLHKADRPRLPTHAATARLLATAAPARYHGAGGYRSTHAGVRHLHPATLRVTLPYPDLSSASPGRAPRAAPWLMR